MMLRVTWRQLDKKKTMKLSYNCCENLVKAAVIEREENDDSDYYVYNKEEMRVRKVLELIGVDGAVAEIEDKLYLGNFEIVKNYSGSIENPSTLKQERQSLQVMDEDNCILIIQYIKSDSKKSEKAGDSLYRYQFKNELGSVSLELNEDAGLISYEEYYPYGGTGISYWGKCCRGKTERV